MFGTSIGVDSAESQPRTLRRLPSLLFWKAKSTFIEVAGQNVPRRCPRWMPTTAGLEIRPAYIEPIGRTGELTLSRPTNWPEIACWAGKRQLKCEAMDGQQCSSDLPREEIYVATIDLAAGHRPVFRTDSPGRAGAHGQPVGRRRLGPGNISGDVAAGRSFEGRSRRLHLAVWHFAEPRTPRTPPLRGAAAQIASAVGRGRGWRREVDAGGRNAHRSERVETQPVELGESLARRAAAGVHAAIQRRAALRRDC